MSIRDCRLRTLLCLLLMLGWQTSAHAFFCFSFGDHARHDARRWRPPPPPLLAPYPRAARIPLRGDGSDLPPIRQNSRVPELIHGYRFRLLTDKRYNP
jgi:hypothetical protein